MDDLRSIIGIRKVNERENDDVRICNVKKPLESHMGGSPLGIYDHVEKIVHYRLVKMIYGRSVEGTRRRGKPRKRWTDAVSEVIKAGGISNENARGIIFFDRV